MPSTDVENWLQRTRDTGTRINMSVSCPKCWKPVSLDGGGIVYVDGLGCQCGTVATVKELKKVFGIEGMSGSLHDVEARD